MDTEQALHNLFAVITLFMMLMADYVIGSRLSDFIIGLDGTILQWILYLALIIVMVFGTFGVPIMIALGKRIFFFNGLIAYGYLMMAVPIIMILANEIWDLATTYLTGIENGTPLIIVDMVILLSIITFAYIIPIFIMLSEEPITHMLPGMGDTYNEPGEEQ